MFLRLSFKGNAILVFELHKPTTPLYNWEQELEDPLERLSGCSTPPNVGSQPAAPSKSRVEKAPLVNIRDGIESAVLLG